MASVTVPHLSQRILPLWNMGDWHYVVWSNELNLQLFLAESWVSVQQRLHKVINSAVCCISWCNDEGCIPLEFARTMSLSNSDDIDLVADYLHFLICIILFMQRKFTRHTSLYSGDLKLVPRTIGWIQLFHWHMFSLYWACIGHIIDLNKFSAATQQIEVIDSFEMCLDKYNQATIV